jgi:putative tryptophan/tyrosine transport system substrate-binding protein
MTRAAVQSILVAVALLAVAAIAEAQKIPQIGYLEGGPRSAHTSRMEAFRQGLRELGYEEGKNIVIEWRFGDGKVDPLSALATELVGLKVAVIVTGGTGPTRAVKAATSTIPILMAQDNDPVASGVVANLARPGGNITGLSNFAPELSSKRLEILREVVPTLSRVAVLGSSTSPSKPLVMSELEPAAKVLGVKLEYLDILQPEDVETAFRDAAKRRADGVTTFASAMIVSQRAQIVELAAKNRLPGIYHNSQFPEAGGLMFYGVDVLDLDRRAATYVDKILKGAKPADLPVAQPTKFELIVNLKTAKQIGVTIPQSVLYRAGKVIK